MITRYYKLQNLIYREDVNNEKILNYKIFANKLKKGTITAFAVIVPIDIYYFFILLVYFDFNKYFRIYC